LIESGFFRFLRIVHIRANALDHGSTGRSLFRNNAANCCANYLRRGASACINARKCSLIERPLREIINARLHAQRCIDISRYNSDLSPSFKYFLPSLAIRYSILTTMEIRSFYNRRILFSIFRRNNIRHFEPSGRRIFQRRKNVSVFARDCKIRACKWNSRERISSVSISGRAKESRERDELRCFCVRNLICSSFHRALSFSQFSAIISDRELASRKRLARKVRESLFFSFHLLDPAISPV